MIYWLSWEVRLFPKYKFLYFHLSFYVWCSVKHWLNLLFQGSRMNGDSKPFDVEKVKILQDEKFKNGSKIIPDKNDPDPIIPSSSKMEAPSWHHLMGKTGKTSFPWSTGIGPKPENSKPSISITLTQTFHVIYSNFITKKINISKTFIPYFYRFTA